MWQFALEVVGITAAATGILIMTMLALGGEKKTWQEHFEQVESIDRKPYLGKDEEA